MTTGDLRLVRTPRLELRAITIGDIDLLHQLCSDPRVWAHFPSGVHTDPERTEAWVARQIAGWQRDGLGCWTVRLPDDTFVGVGGCSLREGLAWNLYYRLRPELQGNGYATELSAAARSATSIVRGEFPVIALLLEHNDASRAVAERSGLRLVWRGPDKDNPDPAAIRLVYADRELTDNEISAISGH